MHKIITFDSLPIMVNELNEKMDYFTGIVESLKPEPTLNEFLNIEETANFLNLSKSTIYSKVNKRELPVMKKGKRLYFSREDLSAYIKSGKVLSHKEISKKADDFIFNTYKS